MPAHLADKATSFLETHTWVSHTVLLEVYFVLTSKLGVYRRTREQGLVALRGLIDDTNLQVHEPEVARAALELADRNPGLSIADCFILEGARKTGNLPLGTFDRDLAACPGARCLLDQG